jgi:HupE / UreJ protein
LTALLSYFVATAAVEAHLMVAQRGTLNMVGDGAFMVLSLPVSAFSGIDDDGDGKLSAAEFATHRAEIFTVVTRDVQLVDAQGARPIEGLMLSLSPPDDAPQSPANQLVVLGRFALAPATADTTALDSSLRFRINLFGKEALERRFQVTVTRKPQTQLMVLTPEYPQRTLLPSILTVFADYVVLGAEHIVMGFDHLLFLLVVLSAGWGWRYVFVALTTFTVGHAITLVISVLGGVSVPASIVEPTIALTIVAMALFDLYMHRRARKPSPWLRVGLVFICSLVHGLGLASALTELGLDGQHQLPSLAGFNVGIEFGQLAIAAAAATIAIAIRWMRGEAAVKYVSRFASLAAILIGGGWFFQRIVTTV